MNRRYRSLPLVAARAGVVLVLGGLLAACETPPPRHYVRAERPVEPVPQQRVYFYPERDQTPEQQDRDRYECYTWAVR